MRKRYLLPIFVVAGLAQAGTGLCLIDGVTAYCEWDACNPINLLYAENPSTATCQGEVDNCANYGKLSKNSSCSGTGLALGSYTVSEEEGEADEICTGYYCDWGSCSVITTDKAGNNGSVVATCSAAIENCSKNSSSKTVYSNATCTTPHPDVTPGVNCNAWCNWGSSCTPVAPDDCSGVTGDCTPTTTCAEAIANCATNSPSNTAYSNSTCTQAITAVLPGASLASLTVLVNGGSLHISSSKEAAVSLFDMQGKQLFSTKVAAGYSVLALKEQKTGLYYAVVQSGAEKQVVKVVVR